MTVVISAAVVWSSIDSLNWQHNQAMLIDLSGRQRKFSQEIRRELMRGDRAAVVAATKLREIVFALRDGGEVTLDDGSQPVSISPGTESALKDKLIDQGRNSQELLDLLNIGQSPAELMDIETGVLDQISKNADQIVRMNVEHMHREIRKITVRTIALVLGLIIVGLWLNRLLVERKLRMKELAAAKDEAIRLSETKSLFVANMSHELRTPLNAVVGMAEVLETTQLNSDQGRYLKTLRRSAEALLELITDILDISKIESGQFQLEPGEFDLVEMIQRLAEGMAFRAQQKGLEFICYIDPEVPKLITADPRRIRQVLVNLLGNAVKFTTAGEIVLRVELDRSQDRKPLLKLSVSDTGIGIHESKHEMIFDKFSQAEPEISSSYGGTGLGLCVCKRLTQLMGGTLSLKSQLGIGSTFTFSIPFSATAGKDVANSSGKDYGRLQRLSVLVVDDNATNRLIAKKYLAGLNLGHIEEARSGAEALAKLRHGKFDLILLDDRMPGMNGLDMVKSLGKEARRNVILLMTSDGEVSHEKELAEMGIVSALTKPIYREQLLNAILQALENGEQGDSRAPETVKASAKQKPRLLIVDDCEDNREVLGHLVDEKKFQIDYAEDGGQAIRMHKVDPYELIFMDLRMTPVDGYTAIELIREWESAAHLPNVPIVVVTAHALKEDLDRAYLAGCNEHLIKPINRARLQQVLAKFNLAETNGGKAKEPFFQTRYSDYLKNRKNDLKLLHAAHTSGDLQQIRKISHHISGTAAMFGLEDLGKLGNEMDLLAKEGNLDEVKLLIDQMKSCLVKAEEGDGCIEAVSHSPRSGQPTLLRPMTGFTRRPV